MKSSLAIAYNVKKHMAKKKLIPADDMGRKHDPIAHEQAQANQDLGPGHEDAPETQSILDERLGMKAQEHEEMAEPAEPMEHDAPDEDDLPGGMGARGGMIGHIMRKKFGHGGPVGGDEFLSDDMPDAEGADGDESYPDPDATEHEVSPRGKLVSGVLERIRMRHKGR